VLSADARKQDGVHFADESAGEGEGSEFAESEVEGRDIVSDFKNVAAGRGLFRDEFIEEEVGKIGLGAFDAAGGDGLAFDIGGDEEVGIGEVAAEAGEFAEGGVGLGEEQGQGGIIVDGRGRRRREKGEVAVAGRDDLARGIRMEVFTVQGVMPFERVFRRACGIIK
jgi:hypothetical protein